MSDTSITVIYHAMLLTVLYPCVICKIHVRPRQHALECDGCFCNSGNFNFILKL